MAILDPYGRPIQSSGAPSGGGNFGVGDLLGGEFFGRMLGRGQEAASRASTAVRGAVKEAGGLGKIGSKGLNLAGRYAPLVGGGIQLLQGDPLGAAGSVLGGVLGAPLGPLGSIAGAALGGPALKAIASPVAQAAQDVIGGVERRQMGAGESPTGVIPGLTSKGIEGLTMNEIQQLAMLQPKVAEQLVPTYNRMRDADMSRQMQLNQQMGQLTGALNQQRYMAELAGGAQSEAGATTRSILTAANPYAASAFQYRG